MTLDDPAVSTPSQLMTLRISSTMGTPSVQFHSFVEESTSPDELEQLGQKAVAWLESERLAGLLPHMHEPSLQKLLNGVLPPPVQMALRVDENGERVFTFAPESEENGLENPRTVFNAGIRVLFFGYEEIEGDGPTVNELRARAEDALGMSVVGGFTDMDEASLEEDEF